MRVVLFLTLEVLLLLSSLLPPLYKWGNCWHKITELTCTLWAGKWWPWDWNVSSWGKSWEERKSKRAFQFSSVTQSCLTLCDPMNLQHTRLPCPSNNSRSLLKLMPTESVMLSNHLILTHHLLLLPLSFPSIRVFSNESVLCTRWPKYWSFSFSISPSNKEGI